VVFLVVSAASPVTSLLGALAVGFTTGNGAGLPAAFAIVTVILLCFAVGYGAIARASSTPAHTTRTSPRASAGRWRSAPVCSPSSPIP